MKHTSLTFAAMLSILPATIAHAQFGSGIVYDPTQSAHAITQIEHEERSISNQIQQIENGQQIFSNTVKIANTALQTYNQVKQQYNLDRQMTLAPRMLYSRFLSPTTDLRMLQQIQWVELLQAGVDRTVIALWLGHESIETTQAYLDADLAMKEKALAKVQPIVSLR